MINFNLLSSDEFFFIPESENLNESLLGDSGFLDEESEERKKILHLIQTKETSLRLFPQSSSVVMIAAKPIQIMR